MTAHALKEDRARCLEAGMDGYVAKPIDIKELIHVVGALTGVAKTDAPPQAGRGAGGDEDAIDWMRAVEKLGGDEFLLGELAAIFLDAYPEMLSEVRTALEQDDAPALQRAAHRLRGSVGNFVARRAIACSERIEEIAETGSLTEAADAVTQLEASLAQMRIALERRVGGRGA
jgi:HPt (histidine-containing phosphotransfer) domain-containing protein